MFYIREIFEVRHQENHEWSCSGFFPLSPGQKNPKHPASPIHRSLKRPPLHLKPILIKTYMPTLFMIQQCPGIQ